MLFTINIKMILKSKYTFHQILTMASIVEYEAILDEERPKIAGVFYNRLENPGYETVGLLQSCATLGYAIDQWKLIYSYADFQVDSPYNTYRYKGLPIGPGGMPGEPSIKAAIYPENMIIITLWLMYVILKTKYQFCKNQCRT